MPLIKPRMCKCSQCRGYSGNFHKNKQSYRTFQRILFNRVLRRKIKQNSKNGNYELPNYGKIIDYFTD